jgi:hypothetical protein
MSYPQLSYKRGGAIMAPFLILERIEVKV